MSRCSKQRRTACKTCPWIRDGDQSSYFVPETLEKTIVDTMRNGYLQECHSQTDYMCSGSLAFLEKNIPGGVFQLQMVRIADRLGFFDLGKVNTDLQTFGSVEEMLKEHAKRQSWSSLFNSERK